MQATLLRNVFDCLILPLTGKCKFFRVCEHFRDNSHTCTVTGGMYYGGLDLRPAGFFRRMEEKMRQRGAQKIPSD